MNLDVNVYEIKDDCRKNLNPYTLRAFSMIPAIDRPAILDMGCGTGVPAMAILEASNGTVTAVDPEGSCLDWLREKAMASGLRERLTILQGSVYDPALLQTRFDIILAEGLLNVVGFQTGVPALISHLKEGGFLIIHDERKNDAEKRIYFEDRNLDLIGSFELDETVWWNEYYDCLEKQIMGLNNRRPFEREIREIAEYKAHPEYFRSIYYVLKYQTLA